MDRLRLEVAVVGGQELFAWPGAARFEREDPLEIVGSGPTGTGEYAGFLYVLFVSDWGSFSCGEEDVYAGRPVRLSHPAGKEHLHPAGQRRWGHRRLPRLVLDRSRGRADSGAGSARRRDSW